MPRIITCEACGKERPHLARRMCAPCYQRQRYAANREDMAAKARDKRAANPAGYRAAAARYRERHPERFTTEARRAEARSYYERNKDKINQDSAEWRRKNPDKRRAIIRRYDTSPEVQLRRRRPGRRAAEYIKALVGDPCSYCGAAMAEIDHIVPVARDGSNDWSNLTAACRSCNARKLDNSLLGFLAGLPIIRRTSESKRIEP